MNWASAVLALVFGAFLVVAETARNWGNWQWWPFWLVDFVAAALLIFGGTLVLRPTRGGSQVLCGAWGFTSAMFYMSFWSHIENSNEVADGNLAQRPLTTIIGILWVITIIGFVLSLLNSRTAERSG